MNTFEKYRLQDRDRCALRTAVFGDFLVKQRRFLNYTRPWEISKLEICDNYAQIFETFSRRIVEYNIVLLFLAAEELCDRENNMAADSTVTFKVELLIVVLPS